MKAYWIIPLSTITLVLPLYLWRELYPSSDWALLFLVFLAVVLFIGVFSLTTSLHQTKMKIAVRSTSPFSKFFTGRFYAGFVALVFIGAALPVLAWQSLTAQPVEAACLLVLSIVAGSASFGISAWLQSHLTSLFAQSAGIKIGTIATAIVFVPILIWINLNYVSHPGELHPEKNISLIKAVLFAINELPPRRGWIAEALSVFYAMDTAKLWLVGEFRAFQWVTILYVLDSALISFVVSSVGTIIPNSISYMLERTHQ